MYPLKMSPAFKDYLWGGERLVHDYGKRTSLRPVAESWELSTHPDGESVVANGEFSGRTLAAVLREHPEWIGGGRSELPVLVKLIDAKQPLSLQVHPATGPEPKNEMWLVLDALPGAEMILGLTRSLSKPVLQQSIADGSILALANRVPVKAGDCFPVPAGMLHAIGAGILLAEVQQRSNTTYRVNDYGRVGPDGNPRQLHIREAVEALDTSLGTCNTAAGAAVSSGGLTETPLTDWEFFRSSLVRVRTAAHLRAGSESAVCLLAAEGTATLRGGFGELTLAPLETAFIPAGLGGFEITGECSALLTTW